MLTLHTLPVGALRTNCYIAAAPNGDAAVIDPGGGAEAVLALLRREGLTLRVIILTHGHFDHILGLAGLKAASDAPILIHRLDAPYLTDPGGTQPFLRGRGTFPAPDTLLEGGESIPLGGAEIHVLHTPGHTPGSVCLRSGTLLFTGDTLFEDDCGRCDLPGGDYGQMLESLRQLAALPGDYQVYPGHDVSTTLERERRQNRNMLEALRSVR